MSRAWYEFALAPAGAHGPGALVAAAGHTLGEALAAVARSHPKQAAVAARRAEVAPLGESIGRRAVVDLEQTVDLPPEVMVWPVGVIPELSALPALAGAAPGFTVHAEPELVVVEAQVGAAQVVDVFLGLVEKLPAADNVEVRLMHHFEEAGRTEVWLSPRIGGRRALRFLDGYERDLINNGGVEVAVYVRAEQSTLRLTEHKTILWLSRDRATFARTVAALRSLGLRQVAAPATLGSVPHFHYRPAGARDRATLARILDKQRMRCVDTLGPDGASLTEPAAPGG